MLFEEGVDTVELVMAIEECFSLSIPDAVAEKIRTAGELRDYVVRSTNARASKDSLPCLSAVAFYRTRQLVAQFFGIDKRCIWPGTQLESILTIKDGRRAWRDLHDHLNLRLPNLEPPK